MRLRGFRSSLRAGEAPRKRKAARRKWWAPKWIRGRESVRVRWEWVEFHRRYRWKREAPGELEEDEPGRRGRCHSSSHCVDQRHRRLRSRWVDGIHWLRKREARGPWGRHREGVEGQHEGRSQKIQRGWRRGWARARGGLRWEEVKQARWDEGQEWEAWGDRSWAPLRAPKEDCRVSGRGP